MNAKEAREKALSNKAKIQENRDVRMNNTFQSEVKLLHSHFMNKVDEAVKRGQLVTEGMQFPSDRFSDEVVREVAQMLRNDGYHLTMDKHNAYQTTKFTVSWGG
jgi:hypothetical protein